MSNIDNHRIMNAKVTYVILHDLQGRVRIRWELANRIIKENKEPDVLIVHVFILLFEQLPFAVHVSITYVPYVSVRVSYDRNWK